MYIDYPTVVNWMHLSFLVIVTYLIHCMIDELLELWSYRRPGLLLLKLSTRNSRWCQYLTSEVLNFLKNLVSNWFLKQLLFKKSCWQTNPDNIIISLAEAVRDIAITKTLSPILPPLLALAEHGWIFTKCGKYVECGQEKSWAHFKRLQLSQELMVSPTRTWLTVT